MNSNKIVETLEKRLLESVNFPSDLRKLDINQVPQLSDQLREETINAVSKIGGHLGELAKMLTNGLAPRPMMLP